MLLSFLIQISSDKKKEEGNSYGGDGPPCTCGSLQNAPTNIK